MSFTTKSPKVKGIWKIESVIVDTDTLFISGNIKITPDFFNKQMSEWEKSESDANYLEKCIQSTYNSLNQVRLNIKRKGYNQSAIISCWDHINLRGVSDGKYSLANDTLKLIDNQIDLNFDKSLNVLIYTNSKYNYQIRYIRLNDE